MAVVSAPRERATVRWTLAQVLGLAIVVGVAVAVRAILLPVEPFRPDIEVYARWAHQIAVGPLGQAYGGDLNLPPVMVYVWAILGALQPAFHTAVDASDTTIRIFLKAPASLADIGLVIAAMWSLRDRPLWAIVGGIAVGLHPALISDSAWWGQTDSLYVLPAFIAFLFARAGRPIPAAIALGVSLMTKPQAMIFIVPFAAFALRRLDRRQLLVCVGSLVATMAVLWSPFILAGGPVNYLRTIATIQNGTFAGITIGAWNAWWLAGQAIPGLFQDATPLLGPINARQIGLGVAALGEIAVFLAVWYTPSPRRLALGLATATLVGFCFLTTMHERYSLAALVFLVPLLPDRRILAIWVVLSLAITANIVLREPWWLVGRVSVVSAGLIVTMTLCCLWLLTHDDGLATATPGPSSPDPPDVDDPDGGAGQPSMSAPYR